MNRKAAVPAAISAIAKLPRGVRPDRIRMAAPPPEKPQQALVGMIGKVPLRAKHRKPTTRQPIPAMVIIRVRMMAP